VAIIIGGDHRRGRSSSARWREIVRAHADEPEAAPVEPDRFGFIGAGLAALQGVETADAQRLVYRGAAATEDHQNQ
jgi:hypothetical protein